MNLQIRALSLSEVELLVEWAAQEGWNPGLHDAAAFRAADPNGFIGAFLDGELVSGISAVAYGNDYGFVGLYITRADVRGQGYGRAVWNAGMARLDGRTIGLDGVPEQQENYRSNGFTHAYGTTRYSGRFAIRGERSASVQPVTPELLFGIQKYERACFPAERTAFLEKWIGPEHQSLVSIENDQIVGFGVARACREGFKVGPLFADRLEVAESLLSELCSICDGDLHLDVPEEQGTLIESLGAAGMTPGFATARMYRGPAPEMDLERVFATTTLELG